MPAHALHLRMKVLAFLLALAACGSNGNPSPGVASAAKPPVDPWATPALRARAWMLTLQSDYGPCDPTDKRSCHKSWTATPDGMIAYVEHPNDDGPATTRSIAMSTVERDRLGEIVKLRDFTKGMADGFPCEGKGPEYDASLRLTFERGGASQSQYVLRCTQGEPTLPGEIVALLRR